MSDLIERNFAPVAYKGGNGELRPMYTVTKDEPDTANAMPTSVASSLAGMMSRFELQLFYRRSL